MRTKSDYEKKDEKRVAFGGASSSLEKKRAPKETHTHTHASFSLFVRRAIRYRAHEESSADETILYDVARQRVQRLRRFRGDGEKRCQS